MSLQGISETLTLPEARTKIGLFGRQRRKLDFPRSCKASTKLIEGKSGLYLMAQSDAQNRDQYLLETKFAQGWLSGRALETARARRRSESYKPKHELRLDKMDMAKNGEEKGCQGEELTRAGCARETPPPLGREEKWGGCNGLRAT